ncbi:MAG: beta-lactamase family protein [Proteobacteria bacterium]|nr:beta-lactamase family protein [Pseudomonadota bacterium]
MKSRFVLCRGGWSVVGLALLLVGTAEASAKPVVPPQWNKVAATFDSAMPADSMVGGSVAFVQDGKIIAHREYGFADRAHGVRVDPDTIFHWASITKTINAITVMQLRDRGLLSLNDPITRYVPELRQIHNPFGSMDAVTIRMLLTHTAGFQGSTWPYTSGADWEPFEPTTWQQLVAMMPYQQIAFPPGTRFSYSNPAWIYLAHALEGLTNDPWEYYVQKNVFAPLGMSRSYFGRTPPYLAAHRSSRYANSDKEGSGTPVTQDLGGEFDPGITIPNGGWNSPLADVATYIGFLTGNTGSDAQLKQRYESVLKRATLEEMWKPQAPGMEGNENIGLAFFLEEHGKHHLVGHTGSQGGFTAFFYCDPATGRGVIAAFNTNHTTRPRTESSAFVKIKEQAMKLFD